MKTRVSLLSVLFLVVGCANEKQSTQNSTADNTIRDKIIYQKLVKGKLTYPSFHYQLQDESGKEQIDYSVSVDQDAVIHIAVKKFYDIKIEGEKEILLRAEDDQQAYYSFGRILTGDFKLATLKSKLAEDRGVVEKVTLMNRQNEAMAIADPVVKGKEEKFAKKQTIFAKNNAFVHRSLDPNAVINQGPLDPELTDVITSDDLEYTDFTYTVPGKTKKKPSDQYVVSFNDAGEVIEISLMVEDNKLSDKVLKISKKEKDTAELYKTVIFILKGTQKVTPKETPEVSEESDQSALPILEMSANEKRATSVEPKKVVNPEVKKVTDDVASAQAASKKDIFAEILAKVKQVK